MTSKTFCQLPWVHLATHPHGAVTLCCEASQNNRASEAFDMNGEQRDFQTLNTTKHNFIRIMNSDSFKKVRLEMLEGKEPSACTKCYEYERQGLDSKRTREMRRLVFTEEQARAITEPDGTIPVNYEFVELRLGNHCNLACRTCNPNSSTKWIADYNKMAERKVVFPMVINNNDFSWPYDESFWNNLLAHCNELRHIYINGGEPLLIDKHKQFLENLVASGVSKNIHLTYSTNATIVNTEYFDVWKEFKQVDLLLSIDDVEDRNHYIRYPAKWSKIEEFIDLVKNQTAAYPNITAVVMQTVSAMNVFYVPEFLDYFHKAGLRVVHNFVYDPVYFRPSVLPDAIKPILLDKLKGIPDFYLTPITNLMANPSTQDEWNKFLSYTKNLDEIRGEDFAKTFPELFELLKPYW